MRAKLNISENEMLWRIPWIDLHLRLLDFPYYEAPPFDGEEETETKSKGAKKKTKKLSKVEQFDSFFNELNDL